MASVTLKAAAAMAFALSQPVLAGVFPENILSASEFEAIPLEKRGSMEATSLWHNSEIPYILQEFPHGASNKIRDAMREWEQRSCIRFIPKKDQDAAWVNFKKMDQGCYSSHLGSPGKGEVVVNLDLPNAWELISNFGDVDSCADGHVPAHMLGHVIGLAHEHQRPDRDQYVHVYINNIEPNWLDQYTIHQSANISVPFDYNSIMLYERDAYTRNGQWTMASITDKEIDPWNTPTDNDFLAINKAYGCADYFMRPIPACRAVATNTDENKSSYKFIIDKYTEQFMTNNNYTHVAAHQNCRSNTINQDTDNWGFTPVNGSGPDAQYHVTVDRCKVNFDRHASRYEVALCKGDNEGTCDIKCGLRRICPHDAKNNGIDSKAVDVVDDVLWVCHPHN
ncbi:zincin [Colletotrichum eremochloae]|nr:zincin [Colletotrichum eremochloae]